MALAPCKECGQEISTTAKSCPKCGAPIKRTSGCARIAVIPVILFVAVLVFTAVTSDREPASAAAATPQPKWDKSAETQRKREDLLRGLQAQSVFGTFNCRSLGADVQVTDRFLELDFDTKEKFLSVFYAWCFDGIKTHVGVSLIDIKSGKDLGRYAAETGLKMN
jgi:hypothetical protein